MQNTKSSLRTLSLAIASAVVVAFVAPVHAQSVPEDIAARAQEACMNDSAAEGFALNEVVSTLIRVMSFVKVFRGMVLP